MSDVGKTLSEHLKTLLKARGPKVSVKLLDQSGSNEEGTLAAVGEDFLELNRPGMTACTVVPFSAIAKIEFQA